MRLGRREMTTVSALCTTCEHLCLGCVTAQVVWPDTPKDKPRRDGLRPRPRSAACACRGDLRVPCPARLPSAGYAPVACTSRCECSLRKEATKNQQRKRKGWQRTRCSISSAWVCVRVAWSADDARGCGELVAGPSEVAASTSRAVA